MTNVLRNAVNAAEKEKRAIAVMYDLSGMNAKVQNCDVIINDWKMLVDSLKITNRGKKQSYLYHNNKPLVAIWGIGFPDRTYSLEQIQLQKLIDFFKNDPEYGGCALMMGIPTYWREQGADCIKADNFHNYIKQADIILPWMVGRFNSKNPNLEKRYRKIVEKDIAWCKENNVDYVPIAYPGFSWHNLSAYEREQAPLNHIPRKKGAFYNTLLNTSIDAGAKMLYIAMFDEVDEGTSIFKCTNQPVKGDLQFSNYEGLPSDFYLKLTKEASKKLKQKHLQ
ncbi:glycoside hydrolase family 71/99 protein [Flammeovirga aprica]|uniref:Xylosidase n=1 Tax=Flammeovirga aprica JL-4 TaxID=694437 RepID=A0A7X9XAH8_9BACT|nr:hypothetical protein [Flammeovirga aprica]NME69671.1 hypothetical protein [Flammeovirga aprica JL-4]